MTLAFILAATLVTQQNQTASPRDSLNGEPVILEVKIGTVASTVLAARRVGDVALLPVTPVLALAELYRASEREEYLSADSLAVILRVPISVDWDELTVTIADDGRLPVIRRAVRERQRALLNAAHGDPRVLHAIDRAVPLLPRNLIVDYDATTSAPSSVAQAAILLGFGANFIGGALDIDVLRAAKQRTGVPAWHWDREFPRAAFLRYARVGHLPYSRNSVIGAGLFLSSDPASRDDPPPVTLAGMLGPDADIEVYRDDLLVYSGETDSFGGYRIPIPASLGSHRITVMSYGTGGEQFSVTRYVSVSANTLASHATAYDVAIGRCASTACDHAVETMVRYAPAERVTAGAGLRIATGVQRARVQPSLLVATHLRDDLNASLRYAREATSAGLQYAPAQALDASLMYASTRVNSTSQTLPVRRATMGASAILRIPHTGYSASAALAFAGYELGDTGRLDVAISLPVGFLYLRPFIDVAHQRNATSPSLERGTYAEGPIPFWLPIGSRFRATVATAGAGGSDITIAAPLMRSGQIEVGAVWASNSAAPRFTMSVNVLARAARYWTRSTSGSDGTTTHSLSGSLTLMPNSSVAAFSPWQSRGRSSIAGVLFLDENRNGVRDDIEPPIPGVAIFVGDASVETDSLGAYQLSDVAPYASIVLSADSLTLPSPDMVVQAVRVTSLPNGVTRVDLAASLRQHSGLLPSSSRGIDRLPQDTQGRDAPSVHRNDLQSRVGNPNPVPYARQPPKSCEYIAAECGPVPVGDFKVVIGPCVDE
jgi:hypothetical protein